MLFTNGCREYGFTHLKNVNCTYDAISFKSAHDFCSVIRMPAKGLILTCHNQEDSSCVETTFLFYINTGISALRYLQRFTVIITIAKTQVLVALYFREYRTPTFS